MTHRLGRRVVVLVVVRLAAVLRMHVTVVVQVRAHQLLQPPDLGAPDLGGQLGAQPLHCGLLPLDQLLHALGGEVDHVEALVDGAQAALHLALHHLAVGLGVDEHLRGQLVGLAAANVFELEGGGEGLGDCLE